MAAGSAAFTHLCHVRMEHLQYFRIVHRFLARAIWSSLNLVVFWILFASKPPGVLIKIKQTS
jgi:hypothetical protein